MRRAFVALCSVALLVTIVAPVAADEAGHVLSRRRRGLALPVLLAIMALVVGCGGTASSPPSSAGSAAPSARTPPPSAAAAPSAGSTGDRWTWAEASSADTALVDRYLAAWTNHDVAAADAMLAEGAVESYTWQEPYDRADLLQSVAHHTTGGYRRISPVFVVVEHFPPALTKVASQTPRLPEGSHFLFYAFLGDDSVNDNWLRIDKGGKIVDSWVGWTNSWDRGSVGG